MNTEKSDSSSSSFVEQLLDWARSDSLARVQMIERLRRRWREDVTLKYSKQPEKLEEILSQGDSAFQQLSKVFRLLNLPPDEKLEKSLLSAQQEFKAKNFAKALSDFTEAFQLKAKMSVSQFVEAGMSAFYLDRISDAEEWARRARAMDSENVQALLLTGLISYANKEFEKAKEIFDSARRLKPESPTIIRYLKAVEDKLQPPAPTKAKSGTTESKQAEARAKRRWMRRSCNLQMTVNDFDQMTAFSTRVRSLSAGGCLIDEMPVPEQFTFILDLGNGKTIQGAGKKIYTNSQRQVGVQFESLSPSEQDLIQRRLMV